MISDIGEIETIEDVSGLKIDGEKTIVTASIAQSNINFG